MYRAISRQIKIKKTNKQKKIYIYIVEVIIKKENSSVAHVHEMPQVHLQHRKRASLLNLLDWIHKRRSALILKLILL